MNRCEAPNCKMRTYAPTAEQLKMASNNYVISFHKFPDHPEKRKSWIDAANKPSWKPPLLNASLCSLHFRDDCFNENNELYDHAVPTIFFDDFGYHMRDIVKKLDLQCKLDEDDASKVSKEFEDAVNSSAEGNQGLPSGIDEDELNFVEYEEVVVYEDNLKPGIENISIPELDEINSSNTKDDGKKQADPTAECSTSESDIADIKIDNSSSKNPIDDVSKTELNIDDDIVFIDKVEKTSNIVSKPNNVADSSVKTAKIDSSGSSESNCFHSATRSPSISTPVNVQPSQITFNKPPVVPSSSQQHSILTSNVTKSPLTTSVSQPDKPIPVQSPDIRSSMPPSSLTSSLSKSVSAVSQTSRITNTVSSLSSCNAPKSTLTTTTVSATKPITASSILNLRQKNTSNERNNFSIMEPASRSLVLQLLNIIKMANSSKDNKTISDPTIKTYFVTAKCVEADPNEPCEVLPSSSVILNVNDYVKSIKDESFIKPKNVSIICGSPAIFLLKNVTVEECDPNMNSVYVITSENLLPHLYKMFKTNTAIDFNQQKSTQDTKSHLISVQTPLQVADLVSSANPKAVMQIQSSGTILSIVSKSSTFSTVPSINPINSKLPNNSLTSLKSCIPSTNNSFSASNSLKPSVSATVSYSASSKSSTNTSFLNSTLTKSSSNTSSSNSVLTRSPSNSSFSYSTTTKLPVNTVKPSTNISTSNSTSATLSTNVPPNLSGSPKSVAKSLWSYYTAQKSQQKILDSKPAATKSPGNVSYSYVPSRPSSTTSVLNSASRKPSTSNVTPSPRDSVYKPSSVSTTTATSVVSKDVSCTNFSRTSAYAYTANNGSTVTKTALPASSVVKTVLPAASFPKNIASPNPPLTRPMQPTACTKISQRTSTLTVPVTQTGVHSVSVNVHQKSQPSAYTAGMNQSILQRSLNVPSKISSTTISAQTAPQPIVNPSSPMLPVNRFQQPTTVKMPTPKPYSSPSSVPSQPQPSSSLSNPSVYVFQPIQPSAFNTNLKMTELLVTYDSFAAPKQSSSTISTQSTVIPPLKRKWGEIDDDEDDDDDDEDDDDPFFATCSDEDYDKEYVEQQRKQINEFESNILQKEREINNLKKKIQNLKKRLNAVRNPQDTKTDEQLIEEILSKYIDSNGVQFFIGQMKVSGKMYTQFRWSEDDKLFALGLLYKNPTEYNILFQKYTLPSDKTLNKFVTRVKKAEMEESRGTAIK